MIRGSQSKKKELAAKVAIRSKLGNEDAENKRTACTL
jgi:hypothetical protein